MDSPKLRATRRIAATVSAALLLAAMLGAGSSSLAYGQSTAEVDRIFSSWREWKSAYDELASSVSAFVALSEQPVETAERLLAVMEARDRVYRVARSVEGYLYVRLQLDGSDEEARSREPLIDETDATWFGTALPWFTSTVTAIGQEQIEAWTATHDALGRYDFFFRRFFDSARAHRWPETGEQIGRLSNLLEQQSERLYRALSVSEAPTVEVQLGSGDSMEVSPRNARTILEELPSAADRRVASRAWLEALGSRSQTYAELLRGIVEHHRLLAKLRGFDSALSAQLHPDGIPAGAVRAAVQAGREASAPLRRYHSLRKRVLQLDEYSLADRFVPLDPHTHEISFAEAQELVIASSATLGPDVQSLVRRAFSDGWIDSVERPGKRPHGGATFVAGHPYVLVNYRGTVENVFQLSHEIGHAAHALLAFETQPFVYSHPSSLTSEVVASVFEGALVDYMVRRAASRNERVEVLDRAIQNILRLFYRPMLDADFELRVYETGAPVTGPALGALYRAVVREFYGDAVLVNDWDSHAWQQVPHFYTSPLYMGRYGLSSAAAHALTSRLVGPTAAERTAAQQAVLDLMRSGGSDYPSVLLGRAGIDLGGTQTIEALVARMEALVNELEHSIADRLK